jgi:hypothetical protein
VIYGELMSHIAQTNYAFCCDPQDSQPPAIPTAADKHSIVKFWQTLSAIARASSLISPTSSAIIRIRLPTVSASATNARSPFTFMWLTIEDRGQAEIYPRRRHQAAVLHDLNKLAASTGTPRHSFFPSDMEEQ